MSKVSPEFAFTILQKWREEQTSLHFWLELDAGSLESKSVHLSRVIDISGKSVSISTMAFGFPAILLLDMSDAGFEYSNEAEAIFRDEVPFSERPTINVLTVFFGRTRKAFFVEVDRG